MNKLMIKIIALAIMVAMLPTQVFAAGSGNTGTTTGGTGGTANNVTIVEKNPFTKAYFYAPYAINLQAPAKTSLEARAVADKVYNAFTFDHVDVSYELLGPVHKTGSTRLTDRSGSYYKGPVYFDLAKPGVYTLKGTFVVVYKNWFGAKKTYSKFAQITMTVAEPPAGPGCSISGPSSGVVGKTYTYSGADWVNVSGTKIVKRSWSVNSSSAKFTGSGQSASLTPVAPSKYYAITYTVTDSTGKTVSATKSVNIIENGPILNLSAQTPLQLKQTGQVGLTVDTKGRTLNYKWDKKFTPYGTNSASTGWTSAVTFNAPPFTGGSGTFASTEAGNYDLTVVATDASTGEKFTATKTIQVVNGLQAAISAKSTITQGETAYAKSISTAVPPGKIVREYWTYIAPGKAKVSQNIDGTGTQIKIDTSILGKHVITLYVMDNTGAISPTVSKTVNVVLANAEALPEVDSVIPGNVDDLLPFTDVSVPDDASTKVCVARANRGYDGSCKSKPSYKKPYRITGDAGLSALGQSHEYDSKFQYWRVTVQLSEYDDNNNQLRVVNTIQKDKPQRENGDSNNFKITFSKEGIYQVYASKWWYYEWQHWKTHTETNVGVVTHKCKFLKYDGGAAIEKHGDITKVIVITPDMVGKEITINADFEQDRVDTESYLVE